MKLRTSLATLRSFVVEDPDISSRTILAANTAHPNAAANLLAIFEKINTFPTDPAELNAWWVSELGAKPPKPKRSSKKSTPDGPSSDEDEDKDGEGAEAEEDDWRKFFDEEPASTDPSKPRMAGARLHKLTIHQSLHSLSSHRAVFTRAWLMLLPRLGVEGEVAKGKALVVRALNVMHRGVLPHLTRPVLVMDWVGGAVDYGTPFAPEATVAGSNLTSKEGLWGCWHSMRYSFS